MRTRKPESENGGNIALTQFEDYRTAKGKLDEIKSKYQQVEERLLQLHRQRTDQNARANDVSARAAELLEGKIVETDMRGLEAEENALLGEREILGISARLATDKVNAIVNARSLEIVQSIRQTYNQKVYDYYEALQKAQQAAAAIQRIYQELAREGVKNTLPAVVFPGFHTQNWKARVDIFRHKAKAAGIDID